MGIGMDLAHTFAAGVFSNGTSTADSVNLYDTSNLNSPTLLSHSDFPTIPRAGNPNRISQTLIKNGLVFSIDANNGIAIFQILTPPAIVRLTEFKKLANGAFQLGYSNNGGAAYTLYASTNLINWTPLGTPTQALPGFFQFTDPEATNLSRRFYQLRWP